MKFDEINVNKTEKQRYDDIKKKGKYVELDILIGAEKDEFEGHTGKLPVVTTVIKGCGPEEIACLYATLQNLCEHFEKEYLVEKLQVLIWVLILVLVKQLHHCQ